MSPKTYNLAVLAMALVACGLLLSLGRVPVDYVWPAVTMALGWAMKRPGDLAASSDP